MNPEDLLRHIRSLEADPSYVRRSRTLILEERSYRPGVWRALAQSFHFGASVALASIFLVVILGGFSAWRFLSPFRLDSLDVSGLRAEAQAIDVQIQLADVTYPTVTETTPDAAPNEDEAIIAGLGKKLGFAEIDTTSGTQPLSIDEALTKLTE